MAAGPVNQALLESYYQNAGEVYDDTKTEGAFQVVADQINENWTDYAAVKVILGSSVLGNSGSEYVKSPSIVGLAGTSVYTQIKDLLTQIQSIIGGSIPVGSITYAQLASDVIAAFVNVSGDTMTGYLTLHANPVDPLHAATKSYVETVAADRPYVSGVYTGNNVAVRDIALPFTPSAVLVSTAQGRVGDSGYVYGGLAVTGGPLTRGQDGTSDQWMYVDTNKFTVTYNAAGVAPYGGTNQTGYAYRYIAFK